MLKGVFHKSIGYLGIATFAVAITGVSPSRSRRCLPLVVGFFPDLVSRCRLEALAAEREGA
jgi:hypothetical protein